jgi:DNA mismatch repair ATPase MutS
MLKDFGDSSIDFGSRITSSISIGGKNQNHAILTGPNRGGKSSLMRGILTNIRYSHAFGVAFAGKAQMTHFSWIGDGLRLDDLPGKQSMFEREVAFAASALKKTEGRGIILYDELFHSTNPPDAKRTSEVFCDSLWKKKNCLSVISTHVYSLAREAPLELVKPICMASWIRNSFHDFSYTVQSGVCEVSSVDLVLKQYNLIQAKAAASL